MSLTRVEQWPSRLIEAVEQLRDIPFEWGSHDCALFAADLVLVMTGEDLAVEFRGKYNSRKSALKAIKKLGKKSLFEVVTSKLGEPIPTSRAGRGDVLLVQTETGSALAVVIDHRAVAAAPNGYELFERQHWITAWRV